MLIPLVMFRNGHIAFIGGIMTDKEIIEINGVDVSGCEDYRPKDRFTCHPYICNCHQKPDCYFKQLARKTQECETLTSQLDFEVQKKECLEQKCEELKAYAQRQENQREAYYKEYIKLSQECEELKKQLKTSEKWRVKSESLNEKLDIENTRYRKALEEIEKMQRLHRLPDKAGGGAC